MNNIIEFKNVSKQYDHANKINVLNKINFNFKKGNIYSFVTDSKNEFEKVIKKSLAQLFKIDITSTTLIDLH